jgi:HEPN domain-containing protein
MNEADRLAEASRWLRYAQEDLSTAESVVGRGVPRQVCWLAQQSVEKALKA